LTPAAKYQEAAELVRASLLSLGRAAAKLHTLGAPQPPPEYYAINRAWVALELLSKDLNRKALGR